MLQCSALGLLAEQANQALFGNTFVIHSFIKSVTHPFLPHLPGNSPHPPSCSSPLLAALPSPPLSASHNHVAAPQVSAQQWGDFPSRWRKIGYFSGCRAETGSGCVLGGWDKSHLVRLSTSIGSSVRFRMPNINCRVQQFFHTVRAGKCGPLHFP